MELPELEPEDSLSQRMAVPATLPRDQFELCLSRGFDTRPEAVCHCLKKD
jgi:hypothetical protein